MQYHNIVFAHPYWLLAIGLLAILWLIIKLFNYNKSIKQQLASFADPELLPYLIQQQPKYKTKINLLTIWSLLWLCGIIAMAGPRWRFIEYETYRPDTALMIVLDLTNTMLAEDIKPNRLIYAKQQIQDLLHAATGIRVGLIAFAKIPHLISPITDDFATISHLLPAVDVDLIAKPGNEISKALQMAAKSLKAELGTNKHILIISSGNFVDNVSTIITDLKKKNIKLHVIGVGTKQGAPYKDNSGNWYKNNGQLVLSKLNSSTLTTIAQHGNGKYWRASYTDNELMNFIKYLSQDTTNSHELTSKVKQWEEGFYWFIFPMLILALIMQHKHKYLYVFLLVVLLTVPQPSTAITILQNSEQQGKEYYDNGNYEQAANMFTDPYRKGVAWYKAGKFALAEQEFKNAKRLESANSALYNLANAQLKQGKYQAAIDNYQELLKKQPEHTAAQKNLAIAKQLLQQNQQQQQNNKQQSCPCKKSKASNNEQANNEQENKVNSNNKQNNTIEPKATTNNTEGDNKKSSTNLQPKEQVTNRQENKEQINDNLQSQEKTTLNSKDITRNNTKQAPEFKANEDYPSKLNAKATAEQDKASANFENALTSDQETKDLETELLLNRISTDIKQFLRNKFYLEEQLTR